MSDLHIEFQDLPVCEEVQCDVVVIAGDLGRGHDGLDWIDRRFPGKPVVYVAGNHEYYRHAIHELTEQLREDTAGTHIHLLENSSFELEGWTFLGCTLWTDFLTGPDPEAHMRAAEGMISDYRVIRNSTEKRAVQARDTVRLHKESVAWLRHSLTPSDPARTIIVTHAAPSFRSESPQYANSPLSPAFCSHLDALVESSGVPLWVHGHTHHCVDYHIGSTRVLSNQRGYPPRFCAGWDPRLVVEL